MFRDRNLKDNFIAWVRKILYFQSILLLAGNYSAIYQRDLFHLVPPPPPKAEVKPIIREPLLSEFLFLKGTVVGNGLSSLAVIENRQSRSENIYREGEGIAGAVITKIEGDAVILLDKDGKEVVLPLSSASKTGSLAANTSPPAIAGPAQPSLFRSPALTEELTPEGAPVSISDISRQVAQNSAEISDLRVAPVISQGQVTGYQVRNVASGSLAARYGIQNGDIVTSVNGIALNNFSQVGSIYRSIRPGTTVAVKILRAGNPLTLNFKMTP